MNPTLIIIMLIAMILLTIISYKGRNQQKELTRKAFYGTVAVMASMFIIIVVTVVMQNS
ncbi:hypothetical protein [Gracilibacillus timonensis]|uniref:hypothetical protein n=1 Tax=Gracilibacillus timonensis TaxID=1816696 RepID=UPI000AF0C516|nr:hypothetical protein [Gracilibacillus timonensis]